MRDGYRLGIVLGESASNSKSRFYNCLKLFTWKISYIILGKVLNFEKKEKTKITLNNLYKRTRDSCLLCQWILIFRPANSPKKNDSGRNT